MSPPCSLCEPFHPKKLHHEDEDHLQHHQQAQTRLAALPSCAEDAKETLRLRLRGHIKATLKAHLHRSQTSHTAQEHHLVTVPCTESEFGTLFSGLPFTFHKGHYTLDLGGTSALETLNRTLGPAWDTQEEPDHLTCFVATRVNEMEYFVRLSCCVEDLASIERTKDYSSESTVAHYDRTHIVLSFYIHSMVFHRPTKEIKE